MKKLLTVFTPTYNRGYILNKCYDSLINQTNKNFIWLIVDDGSTDNTEILVNGWSKEKKIEIQYVKQNNQGKQRAVNTGIDNAKTPYFSFLDSDDYYDTNTTDYFINYLNNYKDNENVAGVLARRGNKDREIIGKKEIPSDKVINYDTLVRKYKFYGDTCRAYKTSILKQHKYPIIKDKFILESVMFSSIDRNYDLLIINRVFSISEYLQDGYTKNIKDLYKDNPLGYALGINELIISDRGFYYKSKATILYTVWCWKTGIKSPFRNCKNKKLFVLVFPISFFLHIIKSPKWIYS